MHRLRFVILLLLATLFQAVSGVFSGGRVLCIGADDHIALETRHHGVCGAIAAKADRCDSVVDPHGDAHRSDTHHGVAANEPAAAADTSCVDLEVTADADRSQLRLAVPAHELVDAFAANAFAGSFITTAMITSSHASWAGPPVDGPMRASLGCLATIVLLI